MFKKTVISVLLAVIALAVPAAASAAGGAVVFSQVTEPRPPGPDGEPVSKPPVGGLFAFKHRHAVQLTSNPADSEPSLSTNGRMIAFVREGDVWAMHADGSGQRQLTSGDEVDSRPLIAPNGRYVLFERRPFRKRGRDLYTVELQGRAVEPLAATPGKEHEAAFSPDGRQIVYVRRNGGGKDDIWSIHPSGGGMRNLTHTPRVGDFAPHYLGGRIVFSRGNKRRMSDSYGAIFSMDRRGRRVRSLVERTRSLSLEDVNTPTRSILFAHGRALWVQRLAGPARKITNLPRRESATGVFSSDGRRVAALIWELWGESLVVLDAANGHLAYGVSYASDVEGGSNNGSIGRVFAWQPVR